MRKRPHWKCCVCGKPAKRLCVPFTLCGKCRPIALKWSKVQDEYRRAIWKAWNIEPMEMDTDNLQDIAERLSEVKEAVHWVENVLFNMRQESRSRQGGKLSPGTGTYGKPKES